MASVVAFLVIVMMVMAMSAISFIFVFAFMVPAIIALIISPIVPAMGIGQNSAGGRADGTADERTLHRLVTDDGAGRRPDSAAPDGGIRLLIGGTCGQSQTQGQDQRQPFHDMTP